MIKDDEFQRISVFMKQRYGIDLSQKKVIVNGRLENYIKRGGWHSFDEFMNAVEHDGTGNQEKMLVNFLTTNHTYFMREFEHFDYFKSQVLPWLKSKESRNKDLRIWCGAASSGQGAEGRADRAEHGAAAERADAHAGPPAGGGGDD